MSREFEISKEVEVEGTPEQVWEMIATGQGIDSWFMGPHTVEPGVGSQMSLDMGFFKETSTITTWEPGKHLAYRGDQGEDGTFHAMEYLVEGRDQGSTVLRFVHSGILGDGWGDEFLDQTSQGWDMYLYTLASHVKHFPGRTATYVYAQGPSDLPEADHWGVLTRALGVPEDVSLGDEVTLEPFGITGVVDYKKDYREFIGVRGPEGHYRVFGGAHTGIAAGHHVLGDATGLPEKWQAFLRDTLAKSS